jgi:endonuclease/exonuclease/phosphatase family metal-dependent hydrolase
MRICKRYICLVVVLIGGVMIWHASQHRPTGFAEGTAVHGNEFIIQSASLMGKGHDSQPLMPVAVKDNREQTRWRFGTFNIHSCKGLDGRRDVDRVAKCLKGLDFVALNEVQGAGFLEKEDQAEILAQRLGMAWLFAPSVRQWYCLESGNGLLTRVPVENWKIIPLVRKVDYSYRNVVRVDLHPNDDPDRRVFHVLLAHVNRRYDIEREAQLKEVISIFLAMPEPALLLGDLNSTAKDPQISQLISVPGVIDAVGQALGSSDKERIDWIFVRGLKISDGCIVENDASDHPLIWVELY